MRRLVVLLAIAAAACLVPGAAHAATPALVLRGNGAATTQIRLDRATTLQVGGGDPARSMSVAGRSGYAGFLVQDARGHVVVGGVVVRGFEVDGAAVPLVFGQGFEQVRVPAGRYRITLLTDGPVEVRIPAVGLRRSLVVRPGVTSSARGAVLRSSRPGAVPVSHLRVPMTTSRSSVVVLATMQRATASAASRYDVCLAKAGATCATGSATGGSGVVLTPGAAAATSITALYFYPGDVAPASYDAVFSTAVLGVGERVAAFALRVG